MEDDFYDETEENCNQCRWCYPPVIQKFDLKHYYLLRTKR